MNSEVIKHLILIDYLLLILSDKMNLKKSGKYVALSNQSIKTINTKTINLISAPTWNDRFELPEGSYFVLDIQDYFENIITKYKPVTDYM